MTKDDLSELKISRAELEAALAPWTVRTHAIDAPPWRRLRARKARAYWLKRLRHATSRILLPWRDRREADREPEFVRDHYNETWEAYDWPDPAQPPGQKSLVFLEWDGTGYETLRHGRIRCHLLGIAKVIEATGPASVLEVGAGPGRNLVALAACFPEIAFAGAELTGSGVATARAAQAGALPEGIDQFAPFPVRSRTAHHGIAFHQADARKLPFPDDAFDLVYTRLAIEQMERIRGEALAEIHRVARTWAVFVEPFADFNHEPLQMLAHRTNNYISLSVHDLPRHGFEPGFVFSDWPHKITNGAGMVVCRRIAAGRDGPGLRPERPAPA